MLSLSAICSCFVLSCSLLTYSAALPHKEKSADSYDFVSAPCKTQSWANT